MRFERRHNEDVEQRLRAERPEPSTALIHAISARASAERQPRRTSSLRFAFAGGLTLVLLVAVTSVSGISYAATNVSRAVATVKTVVVGKSPATDSQSAGVHRTAAQDQYLPPGVTPQDALADFQVAVADANADLQKTLDCKAGSRARKLACETKQRQLRVQQGTLAAGVKAVIAAIPHLSVGRQTAVAEMLADHILQQRALGDAQNVRSRNCAKPLYARAHLSLCAKANPATGATERLRLGNLQLRELQTFLAL